VTLPELTKPQWDAALTAARALMSGDPNNPTDRAVYRNSVVRLAELLPAGTDTRAIIKAAVRWSMLNDMAASLAMIPCATVEQVL
jgi:histidinol-phosphate/aromatic aminotransferase/cobyric acid decarboxylase-like protein